MKRKVKTFLVLSLVATAVLSLSGNMFAQSDRGVFGRGDAWEETQERGMLGRGPNTNYAISTDDDGENLFGNQPFGVTPTNHAPLGNSMLVLIAAGVGYAFAKSKKSNVSQNNKQP